MKTNKFILTVLSMLSISNLVFAHGPDLHVSNKWKECSFQLDPSLTQEAWHQFTEEAGLVTYFRPLIDAKPIGVGHFELSVLQWNTKIDESTDAWNNTFVHPNSEHWLIGGDELPFPGLTLRVGISSKIDAGIYWSERPGANYGVIGAQFQYNIINDSLKNWALSTRANITSLYGPADLNLYVCGVDLLASKNFPIVSKKVSLSTYAGISTFGSHAHEKTEAVNLKDEYVSGVQSMLGAAANIYFARLGVEYNFAKVNSFSYKLGVNFKF